MKLVYIVVLVFLIGAIAGGLYLFLRPHASKPQRLGLRVINVLSKDLYDDAHIAGSEHVEYGDLLQASGKWDKDTPIVLYCSNYQCTASGQGAKDLKKRGFTNVRAYEGGTADWYQLSKKDPAYVIVGPAQQGYLAMVVQDAGMFHDVEKITAQELLREMKNSKAA